MRTAKASFLLFLISLLALASCSTHEEFVERKLARADELAKRRDYAAAQSLLDSALDRSPDDVRLALGKADIHMMAHEYDRAQAWYNEAMAIDDRSLDAVVGRWEAMHEADPDSAVSAGILAEADALLGVAPDSLFNLSAFVEAYYMLDRLDDVGDEARLLTTLYPKSKFADELIKEDIDWIGVERDDQTRLEMANAFLEDYPETRWRPRALMLKLVSLRRLGRNDEVLDACREWTAANPDDPEVLNVAATEMVAVRKAPDEAAALARRAIELTLKDWSEGTEESREDSEEAGYGDGEPGEGGAAERTSGDPSHDQEQDLAGYYLTLSRALVLARDFPSALQAARDGLGVLDTGPDEEETGSAWQFVAGQALEGLVSYEAAFDSYLEAIIVGGRQDRWPARADTAIRALYDQRFAARSGGAPLVEFARERLEYAGPVFTDVTDAVGLSGRNESRIAWGDYDGDGYEDLLLSGRVLMKNMRGSGFVDVTDEAGIGGSGANGGVWADIDNDGDLDMYATSGATEGDKTDRLWRNEGDGTFVDVTVSAGDVTDHYTTEGAGWGDFNSDGYVDLYLASYERPRTETFQEYGVGYPDILYANRGDGTFHDVTHTMGIVPPFGKDLCGRGVNWGDYDNDGDLDIYVSNYRLQENFLWRNEGGAGFVDVAPQLGVSGNETDGWWGHTIGSEWGDMDNDGDLDLFCANLAHPRYIEVSDKSMLYRNMVGRDGRFHGDSFIERRAEAGIKYAETHSDPSWGDVDNDGDLDLFITSIYPNCATFLYLNDGHGDFADATWLAGVRSFNGWGAAMCDYDHDGDLDIGVASASGFHLFRNDGLAAAAGGVESHWLEVKCVGSRSNAAGIGARVVARSGRTTQLREIEGGKGTTSQHAMIAHFGLGGRGGPVGLEVRFLGGATVVLEDVAVDRLVTIVEPLEAGDGDSK